MIALLVSTPASAHPSVSVVIAPNGDVFYSDLSQVWRITRDGRKVVAVPDVHPHELYGDSSGAIFGDDSRWLGGDRWEHRIWKRAPDGRITTVVPWRAGSWPEYGLTRDAAGSMYWVECTPAGVCTIFTRDSSGRKKNAAPATRFRQPINWIMASPAGEIYVVEGPDLRRVNRDGKIETIARIASRSEGRHALMGLARDRAGNVYVAAHDDKAVKRVSPDGKVSIVARSAGPWSPSGVAVSPNGDLWILEWSRTEARVRHVPVRGAERVY